MSVSEILEAVRALSTEEREQVEALIDSLPREPDAAEDRAMRALANAGLLRRRSSRWTRLSAGSGAPVEIKGAPLSATIIEERR